MKWERIRDTAMLRPGPFELHFNDGSVLYVKHLDFLRSLLPPDEIVKQEGITENLAVFYTAGGGFRLIDLDNVWSVDVPAKQPEPKRL